MKNHELLDNVTHKDLRIITTKSPKYGDNISNTGVLPIEFRRVQAEYPIFFRKNKSTENYEPTALLGLEDGENLFLDDAGWDAGYVPMTIERQPFLIGFKSESSGGIPNEEPVVFVDMDSARISKTEGETVFLEQGGISPFLEHINSILKAIHEGHADNKVFCEKLVALELLEPFTLEVELKDGAKHRLAGLHTINEEILKALNSAALKDLHRAGYLEHIYMAMASIANLSTLIAKKNERL